MANYYNEHQIGETFTLPDGRKVEVVEGKGCYQCVFFKFGCIKPLLSSFSGYQCSPTYRRDHKNVIYKEIKEN